MIEKNLFDKLFLGATLLTPTRRLATAVTKAFDQVAFDSSKKIKNNDNFFTWESPTILSLKDWSLRLWETVEIVECKERYLLSSHESLLLMETIIQQSSYAAQLLRPHSAAKLVLSAWQILHNWRQIDQLKTFDDNVDQRAMQFFCQQYTNYLHEKKLLDEVQWLGLMGDFLTAEEHHKILFTQVKHLICYGFDDITPQFSYLLQTLEKAGWLVETLSPPEDKPQNTYLLACQDRQSEILQAACWAKQILVNHQDKKTFPSIGIVLPNLPEHRDNIIAVFESVFSPNSEYEPESKINPSYNLSTAIPLLQYPIIQSCFSIFKLLKKELYVSEVISLLSTPYIHGSMTCYEGYQAVQSTLQTQFKEKITLQQLIDCVNENIDKSCGSLLEILQSVKQKLPSKQNYSFSRWRQIFQDLLALFDWPGERSLNSIEYQAVNRFYIFLDEFMQLDAVFPPQNSKDILDKLQKYVSNIAFQPENQGAPIQILGILEASGLHFDYLWLMQLHHENWPPKAEPNPFIPIALQKQMLMPHASPLREYEFAKKMTERLLSSAQHIICSYPISHDNNPAFPSELIGHLSLMDKTAQEKLIPLFEQNKKDLIKTGLDFYYDFDDFPLENLKRQSIVKGGSQVLAYQAQCPFKAFAKIRMNAKKSDEWSMGVDPKLRGTLLHECLYHFWAKIKSQENLFRVANLQEEIAKVVKIVISKYKTRFILTEALWQIEIIRLQKMIFDCITLEKSRPSFQVVALEESKTISIKELKITVYIDRVDCLSDNQYLLIDYKTGSVNLNEVICSPLKAPQLPLYLHADFSFIPRAAMWFVIQPEKNSYIGISDTLLKIEGVKTSVELMGNIGWDDRLVQWRFELEQLADDFLKGKRMLQPLEGDKTCRLCDLHSFCRIEDKREVEKSYG